MKKKLCVIGLDCVTPELYFDAWRDEMPNLCRLLDGGIQANMVSTIPAITVPAWMAMMTSQDPGQLGIYGFRNRASNGYDDLFTVNSTYVTAKTVWNHLSRNRLRSIVMGVPLTFPVKPLNGVLVASFLTPDKSAEYTWPADIKHRLDDLAGGDYVIDVRDFRNDNKDETLAQIQRMTAARFNAFRGLLQQEEWDFAMMVEMGPDRLHHAFWRYHDKTHRLYEPGNKYENVIHDYYLQMDQEIGRTLAVLPDDASVIVVSDHGAKPMHGVVCINEWLIDRGLLKLKAYPDKPTRLTTDMIDWSGTKVWGDGGYYARIFINVEGREPNGIVPQAELPAFKAELKAMLEGITDDQGKNIGTRAFVPEEIYRETNNTPPDFVVYLGDLDWRSGGDVGVGKLHLFENNTGPDDANHAQEGVFVWHGRGKPAHLPDDKISIYDIAPSILDYFGIDKPAAMIGNVI